MTIETMRKHVTELETLVERARIDETIKGKSVPRMNDDGIERLEQRLAEAKHDLAMVER